MPPSAIATYRVGVKGDIDVIVPAQHFVNMGVGVCGIDIFYADGYLRESVKYIN